MLGCLRDDPQRRQAFLGMTARRETRAIMTQEQTSPAGPNLTQGVALADFVDGRLVGHVGKEESAPIARTIMDLWQKVL